jgi:hypothetical protein
MMGGLIGIGQPPPPPPGRIALPVWTISGDRSFSHAARCVDRRMVSAKSVTHNLSTVRAVGRTDFFIAGSAGVQIWRSDQLPRARHIIRPIVLPGLGRLSTALQFRIILHELCNTRGEMGKTAR